MNCIRSTIFGNQAYSIIELAVVILIIGIIMTIAVPAMNNYMANYQLQAECLQLQRHIRSVAQEALVKDSDSFYIRLYLADDKYRIVAPSANGNSEIVQLPEGIDLAYSNFPLDYIRFSGKGKPVVGGHVRLTSKKTGKMQYVIVAAVTGRTRISHQPPLSSE
ncbi:prepilin-type N-terminal cleavage/methylation domain-containing protein [Desulfoscipio gibsoniae]|uniref:Prepilin-type N-terminal cleavage/methylation domain-containing protein n=1 Tax=Desulfoscipio gibsoniae DSM 7213 TaxID=767817 RepID=R4KKE8_9FIRM|nr:prepilin-type N-terminal cleavage/methylation domain-containing protein [Desulfoscipio gibsoniae]AGL02047.1 prepilin-type N-terminal cleavage/methylation domain-containing protein [Desulfoscipio gibsoniae DSM 7213]